MFCECNEELGKLENLDEDYEKALGEFNSHELDYEALWDLRNLRMFMATQDYESKHLHVNLLSKVCTLLNIIEIVGNLTVRVAVFSGRPNEVAACGMLFRLVEIENLVDQPGDVLYFTIVIPKHVISTEEHVQNATVQFFIYEDGHCDYKFASCVEVLCSNDKSDFSEVVCKTNDKTLAANIKNLFDLKSFKQAQKCGELKKPSSQYDIIKKLDNVLGKINKFDMFDKLLNQTKLSTNSDAHLPEIMYNPHVLMSTILQANSYNIQTLKYLVDALWQDLSDMEKG